MTFIFICISLLLHSIAFFLIFHLIKRINTFKQTNIDEIQKLFEQYLEAFKKENDRLQEHIFSKNQSFQQILTETSHSNKYADENVDDHNYSILSSVEDMDDSYETSLQSQILQLYDQGYSEEDIAKQLNCGKTEVELIVKFHQ